MPGFNGPGFAPLDTPGTGTTGGGGFTVWDVGGCGCEGGCFGCVFPQGSFTGSFSNPTFSETGSGTIAFLGSNTSLTWNGSGLTSKTGACWSGNFLTNRSNRIYFQLVCSPGCTAAQLTYGSNFPYTNPGGCDTPGGTNFMVVISLSCSPLSITLQVYGNTYYFTITP